MRPDVVKKQGTVNNDVVCKLSNRHLNCSVNSIIQSILACKMLPMPSFGQSVMQTYGSRLWVEFELWMLNQRTSEISYPCCLELLTQVFDNNQSLSQPFRVCGKTCGFLDTTILFLDTGINSLRESILRFIDHSHIAGAETQFLLPDYLFVGLPITRADNDNYISWTTPGSSHTIPSEMNGTDRALHFFPQVRPPLRNRQ